MQPRRSVGVSPAGGEVSVTVVRNRVVGAVVTAAACAAVLSTTCTFTSGVRALMAEVGLVSNDGWIMGGTGDPTPDSGYLSSVESLYLGEDSGYTFDALTTRSSFVRSSATPASRTLVSVIRSTRASVTWTARSSQHCSTETTSQCSATRRAPRLRPSK